MSGAEQAGERRAVDAAPPGNAPRVSVHDGIRGSTRGAQ